MIKTLYLVLIPLMLLSFSVGVHAQGKYAGAFKKLIGKTFTDEKHLTLLPGYKFHEGSVISDPTDPLTMTLTVLTKGTNAVVVFSQRMDSVSKDWAILDLIDIRNIQAGWQVKTVGCQYGDAEGQIIVALANPGKEETTRQIKQAWICEPDRIRFETVGAKNIHCLNEGQD